MGVFTVKKNVDTGVLKISMMGIGESVTHVHIDNYKTKKNSVCVPIGYLLEALKST